MSIEPEAILKKLDEEGVIANTAVTFPDVASQSVQGKFFRCNWLS